MSRRRALVIGGSLGGLFTAGLLRTIGWNVHVCERARGDLSSRGAGLGTQPALFSVMRQIGIDVEGSIGVAMRSRICLARSGNVLCEVPQSEIGTAWDRIYRALRNSLPSQNYHSGKTLVRFEQSARCVTAIFSDGSRQEAELLVGADGINSTVRCLVAPGNTPRYAGYVAWRGVIPARDVSPATREILLDRMAFGFPRNGMVLAMPLVDPDDGREQSRCQFSWFRPVDYGVALPQLCTDVQGRCHGTSIAPTLIRPDVIKELADTARTCMAPQIAELVAQCTKPILVPVYDLASPRMVFGRVVLLGDAAFVARPHVGTGVTKAVLDARALAELHRSDGRQSPVGADSR